MDKLIFGVGINDATYKVKPIVDGRRVRCPYYTTWINMLTRAYSEVYLKDRPSYKGVTVDSSWHTFSVFREWLIINNWKVGEVLDKDLLYPNNKIYSPATCILISYYLNNLIKPGPIRELPQGVSKNAKYKDFPVTYKAQITVGGNYTYLGSFISIEEARLAYMKAKCKELVTQIELTKNIKIKAGLTRHIENILNKE